MPPETIGSFAEHAPSPDYTDWLSQFDPSLGDLLAAGTEIIAEHEMGGEPLEQALDQAVIANVMHLDDEGEFSADIETPTAEYLGNLVFRSLTEAEEEIVAKA